MACPVDGATLTMSERQGIEIDYCPSCRGVWLDRGELDKIIERSAAVPPAAARGEQEYEGSRTYGHGSDHGSGHGHGGRSRKRSFLGDLFD
jgi:Zn-finger nucleic acid-binding protein